MSQFQYLLYSDDSLINKWRTHLSGAFGVFSNAHEIHLSGAPEKLIKMFWNAPKTQETAGKW